MPVSFTADGDDAVIWRQQFQSPTVYLDTWAIREISASNELSARFANSIKASSGTWMLAALSVGEFARFKDPRHAAMADALLAKVVPNIYLAQTEPVDIWEKDQEPDDNHKPLPAADVRNLDWFACRYQETQSVNEALKGMFGLLHQSRDKMELVLDEVADKVIKTLADHRQLDAYRVKAKASNPDGIRSRIKIIFGELLRDLILDQNAPLSRNDALDLMHAVDAVNYCDHVLLDKGWERRVNALQSRITASGIEMPIAQCYSQRNNGLEAFLSALESHRA